MQEGKKEGDCFPSSLRRRGGRQNMEKEKNESALGGEADHA